MDLSDYTIGSEGVFRRKYVWQWPIRIFHWINALSVAVLFATGLYIAKPFLAPTGEAFDSFIMGGVIEAHLIAAFIFIVNYFWRIYWFWAGNNYARSGFPFFWRKIWWKDLFRQLVDYLRLSRGHVHLGHNALSGLTYTVFIVCLGFVQIITGLALFSESNPGGFWSHIVGWVIPLAGGSFQLRTWHYLFAWGFLFFAILHIYVVFYDGQQYKNGLVSSMVSGVKFYKDDDLDSDTWLS